MPQQDGVRIFYYAYLLFHYHVFLSVVHLHSGSCSSSAKLYVPSRPVHLTFRSRRCKTTFQIRAHTLPMVANGVLKFVATIVSWQTYRHHILCPLPPRSLSWTFLIDLFSVVCCLQVMISPRPDLFESDPWNVCDTYDDRHVHPNLSEPKTCLSVW